MATLAVVLLVVALLRLRVQMQRLTARIDALEAAIATTAADGTATQPATAGYAATPQAQPSAGQQPAAPQPGRQPSRGHADAPAAPLPASATAPAAPSRDAARSDGKFATPQRLDLNSIDSATLVRVPGIAGRTAQAILAYREQLGGYAAPRQLAERLTWDAAQERMAEWCRDWFWADTLHIRRLDVNTADFRTLLRHPYLSYQQVQQLVQWRDRHKRVGSMEVLRQMDAFTDDDIARLTPYLSF